MTGRERGARGGFAMLAVVLALGIVAVLAFLVGREGAIHRELSVAAAQGDAARYVAEAGLQHARWQINQAGCSGYANLLSTPFGPHSYSATLSASSGSPVTISALGSLAGGASRSHLRENVPALTDPLSITLQSTASTQDTFVRWEKPNENKGNVTEVLTDSEVGGKGPINTLIRLDLSSIPAGAVIDTAELELVMTDSSGDQTDVVEAHRALRPWVEGDGTVGSGATWFTYDGINIWTNPGGDYDPAVEASFVTGSSGEWKTLDLTFLTRDWLDGVYPNDGVILVSPPNSGNNEKKYRSSDHSTGSNKPRFRVTYRLDCAAPAPPGSGLAAIADTEIRDSADQIPAYTAEDGEIGVSSNDIDTCDLGPRRDSMTGWANWAEATAQEYANLLDSDDAYYQTADPGPTDHAAEIFEFSASNDSGATLEIDLSIEASPASQGGPIMLCLWNYATGRYDKLGRLEGGSDSVHTQSVLSPAGTYVDPVGGPMTLFVVNKGPSHAILVDQVSVAVRQSQGAYRAFDGEIDVIDADIDTGNFGARRDTIPGWSQWQEASAQEYTDLESSDDQRYQTADPGKDDNAAFLFELYFSEDPARVGEIEVSVEIAQGEDKDAAFFYLWDYDAGQYDPIGSINGSSDSVFSASVTTDPARYLNPADGQMTLFVVNKDVDDWLRIDLLSVGIASSALAPGMLSNSRYGLIRFDVLSALPPGATILSAVLRLYEFGASGSPYLVGAHKVSEDWTEAGADWATADGLTPWAGGPGGSYDPVAVDSVTVNEASPGWRSWDVTPLVQEWVDGVAPDHGIQLVHEPLAPGNQAEFYSREGLAGSQPELVVVYEP